MERRLPVPGEQAVMDGALEAALLAPEREQSVGRGWGREAKPATKIKRKERGGGGRKTQTAPHEVGTSVRPGGVAWREQSWLAFLPSCNLNKAGNTSLV